MGTLVFVYIGFTAVIGLVIAGVVALRPKLFWPILIVVVVGTLGLKVQGYCLIDEYLTGCILIGGLLPISIVAVSLRRSPTDELGHLHRWVFLLMIVYMIIESIRGLLLWEDLRLTRWILYYGMLGMLSFVISRGDFPVPSARRISLIVSWSALLYFIAYLAQGLYAEAFRGISRWATQAVEWSGSAYAVFPLIVAIPAAIFLLKDSARNRRWLGWAVIIISMMVAYYYESRVSYLVILGFLVVSPIVLGVRRVAPFSFLCLCLLGLFYCFGNWEGLIETVQHYARMLSGTATALWSPQGRDVDRYLHMQVSFIAVSANLATLLFGYGVHSHRFVIGQYLRPKYAQHFPGVVLPKIVRTEAFTALLVDTGFIGMLLLAANFLFVAHETLVQKSPIRIILLLALVMSFLWLLVGDIQDIVLLYLMIMPSGLLVQLSRRGTAEQPLRESN